jgi:hypothetical protein
MFNEKFLSLPCKTIFGFGFPYELPFFHLKANESVGPGPFPLLLLPLVNFNVVSWPVKELRFVVVGVGTKLERGREKGTGH